MADRISYEVDFSAKGAQTLWNDFLAGSQSAGRALNESLGGRVKKELFLEVRADDSGVKRVVAAEREVLTELQKIINLQEKANRTQQGSVTSLRQQVNEAKQARDGMVKYASAADGVSVRVGNINAAWDTQNQKVKDLKKQLDIAGASNVWEKLAAEYNLGGLASTGRQISELVNVFQSISIIVGQVIGSINQLFDALQKLQSIKLTFEGIGKGSDVATVFSESSRIALGLGVSLNTVRDGFQQLSPVILATGGNISDVSAITESLSSRFVTFGLSADKSRRVMNGVVQAFSKGKLMAEELTQQISEADPAFRTDLANAIGVTVKELGEMVQAGQITNDVLLEAIPRMTKASGLFGKLGDSALDAAQGFREGGVTVEQFRNQIATIEQLSLENLVNPGTGSLQPLLASLLELRAVVTDVGVAFANSEVFKTFIVLLGSVASQISFVIQTLVKLVSAVASITQPIFGAINAVDSLGGLLKGFGLISSVVAGIIVTKLVASLVTLGSGAIVGAATAAITGLTKAIVFFSSGAAVGLANSIAASIVQFAGLTAAAARSAVAQTAATAATAARAGAGAFLLKALGLQTAAEALAASAAGTAAAAQVKTAGGIVITGAAATAATPPVTGLAAATTSLAAAGTAVAIPFLKIAAVLAVIGGVFLVFNAASKEGAALSSSFAKSLTEIQAGADAAKKALKEGADAANEFSIKLRALEAERQNFNKSTGKGGVVESIKSAINPAEVLGQALDFIAEVSLKGVANAATETTGIVLEGSVKLLEAIKAYDQANDKSGQKGKQLAIDIVAQQSRVGAALDLNRAKLKEFLEQEAKDPRPTSEAKLEQLRILEEQIKLLEEVESIEVGARAELRKKGVAIDVELNLKDAAALTGELQEKIKGLKASVTLEANPEKKAKLQGDLNGLKAQLEFLEADPVEVKINAEFKINQRALQDAASLSDAVRNRLVAAAAYAQSLSGLQAAYLSGTETTRQTELKSINERLDKEKEIRSEALEAAQERGASEVELKALEKSARDAEKAGRNEIKAKEKQIEVIAEKKRQIELQALQAKLAALPQQQQAERDSLITQQKLADLELQRLKAAAERARLEGKQRLITLGGEISEAKKDNRPGDEQAARDLYNNQLKLNALLDAEGNSLDESARKRSEINASQLTTLGYKQATETLDAQSAVAAANGLTAQKGITTAVQATAAAQGAVVRNVDAAIQKQNKQKALQDARNQTSEQLRNFLAQEYWNKELANISRSQQALDRSRAMEQIARDERKQALQEELTAVQSIASARIESLQELTGAEKALADLQRSQLRKTAKSGDTKEERLQARAQLERIEREKKIAAIQKRAAAEEKIVQAELKKVEDEERQAQKKAREEDRALQKRQLMIQEELLKIAEAEKNDKIDAAKQVLASRDATAGMATSLGQGAINSEKMTGSLEAGATAAGKISSEIRNLDGLQVNVRVNGVPGRWAGGPTIGGQTYQVNELGKEGFLSSSGDLSPINRPRNALWKAPGKGMVIPAHIMSTLDVPTGRVSTGVRPAVTGSGGNGLAKIARAIQSALSQANKPDSGLQEMAAVQAHQALQIGKLSRAVSKLADKDWNVNVGVRNTGSTAYLDALNRRM